MARTHMVELQRLNAVKQWEPIAKLHAGVNKYSGKEYLEGGAIQSQLKLVFDVRYSAMIAAIQLNTQLYRILYNGGRYKIVDYDDFQERHRSVKLLGVSYG